jgi:hypothetical protein
MSNEARIKLSVRDGILEIEGSEKFVSEQADAFREVVASLLQQPRESNGGGARLQTGTSDGAGSYRNVATASSLSEYETVFVMADGKIQILKGIPGNGKAGKTMNAALLCLFANELQGNTEVGFDTIRDLCQAHGFLDSSNFSATLKEAKEHLIITGTSRRLSAKLTVPGRKEAQRLAEGLKTA